MLDLLTLAQFCPEDLDRNAVSLAATTWFLNGVHLNPDTVRFYRGMRLVAAIYLEEQRQREYPACPTPLLDRLRPAPIVTPSENPEDDAEAIASRFHADLASLVQ